MGSNPTGPTIGPPTTNPHLIDYAFHLKKEGYRPSTIERHVRALKNLPLSNPEEVKSILASSQVRESVKELVSNCLARYYQFSKVPFSKPIYKRVERNVFLPYEEECIQLIAELPRSKAAFCQLLKETGCRAGEAMQLKWSDINNGIVSIEPEKGSKPRQFQLSPKLLSMIHALPRKGNKIWNTNLHHFSDNFYRQRRAIADRLGNPRINSIRFHSFRHLKASREYAKTKDLVHVQRLLGHRSIASTLRYIQLQTIGDDDFICKAASTPEEGIKLIEAGFAFEASINGVSLFKKRK